MFFISIKKRKNTLDSKDKCVICSEKIQLRYNPMEEWGMEGSICGKCYSKKLSEHYPGEHVRVNKHLD
jgi:hypothetical protein|tara:strand:+ start:155 stop:358 length:204 start_codon:yes stop_codon:yes gene_type:complete